MAKDEKEQPTPDKIVLIIDTIDGQTDTFTFNLHQKLAHVKLEAMKKFGLQPPNETWQLSYNNVILDENLSIQEAGFKGGERLLLLKRPQVG